MVLDGTGLWWCGGGGWFCCRCLLLKLVPRERCFISKPPNKKDHVGERERRWAVPRSRHCGRQVGERGGVSGGLGIGLGEAGFASNDRRVPLRLGSSHQKI